MREGEKGRRKRRKERGKRREREGKWENLLSVEKVTDTTFLEGICLKDL
jgi:hypothetical protein